MAGAVCADITALGLPAAAVILAVAALAALAALANTLRRRGIADILRAN